MDLDPYEIREFAVFWRRIVINYLQETGSLDEMRDFTSTLLNNFGRFSIKRFLRSTVHPSNHISKFNDVTTFEHFKTKLSELKSSIEFKSLHAEFYEKCVRIITLGYYFHDRYTLEAGNKNTDGMVSTTLQELINSAYVAGYLDEFYDIVRKFVLNIVYTIFKILTVVPDGRIIEDQRWWVRKKLDVSKDLSDYIEEEKAKTLFENESYFYDMDDEKLDFLIKEAIKWEENRLRETENKMFENLRFVVDIAYIATWFYETNKKTWMNRTLDKLTEFIILKGRQESSVLLFLSSLYQCL